MGWSVGFDRGRDIGYGVPALCDYPGCGAKINRGLSYVCGSDPRGGEYGCGLYFCERHLAVAVPDNCVELCERCAAGEQPFDQTPDLPEWLEWKLTDESWQRWRDEHPDEVEQARRAVAELVM